MSENQNLLSGKRKYLFGFIIALFLSAICVAFGMDGNNKDFDISRREVMLRRIGDQLLLNSGDRTSRVLPVEKIAEAEYLIRFGNELSFQPDSLMNTVRDVLAKDPLGKDYIVNVLNCDKNNVVYGFAISGNKKDDIVACKGRNQPTACYTIHIKFKPESPISARKATLISTLPIMAFIGFIFLRSGRSQKSFKTDPSASQHMLGSILFDTQARQLVSDTKTIDLTGTETRLLLIFALSPNEIIERSRLQKEIWEDEGVIVGRSLDMFISKLRKKLELDPNISISVVRSKGYKLEIN